MPTEAGDHTIVDVLADTGLVSSKSEARRAVEQGGVKGNGEVVNDVAMLVAVTSNETLLQKGKRHFVKVISE